MTMSTPSATLLLLMTFPTLAIADGSPMCDLINPYLLSGLGCYCVDTTSGTGGIATCTMTVPDPPIVLPQMGIAGINIFDGGQVPQVTAQVGTEVRPCAEPARAEVHAKITIPAGIQPEIIVMLNELIENDVGISFTGSAEEGLTLRIDQSAEAGQSISEDIPFYVAGGPGAKFRMIMRITMTVNTNAGSLAISSNIDMCLETDFNQGFFTAEMQMCGATLPTCINPDDATQQHNCVMGAGTWPGPWCCSTNQMNLHQLMGSPPFDVFKITQDFTDVCQAAGSDPYDPDQAPNPNKPAGQSTNNDSMNGGAIAGLVIGLVILAGIIVFAVVNRNKFPCLNSKSQLNEVTELGIENK